MASDDEILRIRRTDDQSAHLLLRVTQIAIDSRQLDLKLVATEHEHLYHASITSATSASLQASNNRGTDDEWQDILVYSLCRRRSEGTSSEALQGLEIVAGIADETCTITIRRNIGGITMRLGSINLDQDDEKEEVNAFEWADLAVSGSDDLRSRLEKLQVSVESYQDHVAKLNAQLDELVKAKKDHEDQLLQKFAALLNAKKLKIRDQQRLLSGSQIKSGAAAAVHAARNGPNDSSKRKAGASARTKRKAGSLSPEEEEEMALDLDAAGDEVPDDDDLAQEDEDGQQTPDQQSTADDASDDDGFAPPPAVTSSNNASQTASRSQGAGHAVAPMDVDEQQELPPKRQLPFARPRQDTHSLPDAAPAVDEDDEDETDDEL